MGCIVVQPETLDDPIAHIPARFGHDYDQEGQEPERREGSELKGAVHEVDGVESGPQLRRSAGLDPLSEVRRLCDQPMLLLAYPLRRLRDQPMFAIM
jgi:hypothetical protein